MAYQQLGHACRRRALGVENAAGADGERERKRISQAVGEEELGYRKRPVLGADLKTEDA